jgi:hypothetical protein
MDPILTMVLGVFMRWVHIMSVVLLIGGVIFARVARSQAVTIFAPKVYWIVAALVISGAYNFYMKPSYPPHYHMWFGIKMLLALHVISMLILLTRTSISEAKRLRWMSSVAYSGTAIIAVSAILRWLSLTPSVKLP